MWMNARAYAEMAGMPVRTIRRLCRSQVLPHIQVGRVYQVNVDAANETLEGMAANVRPAYTDFQSGIEAMRRRLRDA